jgi:hypothetical protein
MYFLGNGSNRIITKKAQIDTFQELATGDSVSAKFVVHGTAKAWANLNGTGTIALRDSLNVSSVVDNGVGDYTFNFSNVFSNPDYCINVSALASANAADAYISTRSTSSINGVYILPGTAFYDIGLYTTAVHGDLA